MGRGGWWIYKNHCADTNPTGHHSSSKKIGYDKIVYYHAKPRSFGYYSWAGATNTLVPRTE